MQSCTQQYDQRCAEAHCLLWVARPKTGLLYGVNYHRDTSGDTPTQQFTSRNIRNLSWSVAYSVRPTAFNVSYYNRDLNYEQDEVVIDDPYAIPGQPTELEAVQYVGLVTEDQVRTRALFDFEQSRLATLYTFEVGLEHLAVDRGDIALLFS